MDRKAPTLFTLDKDVIGLEAQRTWTREPGGPAGFQAAAAGAQRRPGDGGVRGGAAGSADARRAAADAKFHEPMMCAMNRRGEIYGGDGEEGVGVVGR